MPKFTDLERQIIRIAYSYPKGSVERTTLREVLAVHFETEAEWESYKEEHPDADESNHTFEFKGQKDPEAPEEETEEEDSEKKDEGDESSDKDKEKKEDEEKPKPGSKEESVILQQAKAKAKEAFAKGWDKTKQKVGEFKGKMDKLKSEGANEDTFGEVVELMAAMLSAVFIPDSGGSEFLDSVMSRVESKAEDKQKTLEAIANMKAAEAMGLADDDLYETMLKNGLQALSQQERQKYDTIAKGLRGELKDEDMDDSDRDMLFDFLTDMDDDRIQWLKDFTDKDSGTVNMDGLKMALLEKMILEG